MSAAPGIAYETRDGLPGQQFFLCRKTSCTLTVTGCAGQYRRAKAAAQSFITPCRDCPIGAAHAGEPPPRQRPNTCVRCGRKTPRLVNRVLCKSCDCRQREVLKGRDARGRPPRAVSVFFGGAWQRNMIPHPHRLVVAVAGIGLTAVCAATMAEAARSIQRRHPGAAMTWTAPRLGIGVSPLTPAVSARVASWPVRPSEAR